MIMAHSDLELLDRFRESGDADAFREIVRRYASTVYAAGRRVLADSSAAEDVTQETFFRLMRKPGTVRQSLGGWLHAVATRLAVDMRRSDTSRRRREIGHVCELANPTWAMVSQELDEAMATLPDASRELIVRHFLRGESQARLAADLSTSAATLSRRMKVSIEELRLAMRQRGIEISPAILLGVFAHHIVGAALSRPLSAELAKMTILCAARTSRHAGLLQRLIRGLRRYVSSGNALNAVATIACTAIVCVAAYICSERALAAGFPTASGSSRSITQTVDR